MLKDFGRASHYPYNGEAFDHDIVGDCRPFMVIENVNSIKKI